MIYYVLLASFVVTAWAQRPTYAGSGPIGTPQLASRFRDTSTSTSTSTTTAASGVANRNGGDGTSTTTVRLPVDARGDADLVNRLSQWPRENQPFWLINAEHIEKHRNPGASARNNTILSQSTTATQSASTATSAINNNNISNNRDIPVWEPDQENAGISNNQQRIAVSNRNLQASVPRTPPKPENFPRKPTFGNKLVNPHFF